MSKLYSTYPNFRGFALFSALSGVGRGMFAMFMMWAVHAMYHNPVYTGLAGFMFTAPLAVSFLVGPFVDKWRKVTILQVATVVKLCTVLLILAAHMYLAAGIWFYLAAILIFSIAGLFSAPAATALLPHMVDSENLAKANATINILGVLGGLGVGVALYRLLQQGVDFALIYGVNGGILALALLCALILQRDATRSPGGKTYFADLAKGFAFVKKGVMLPVVFFLSGMTFFSQSAYVNLPMFAELHLGTASGYILLSALALVGGLVGSWVIGNFSQKFDVGKLLIMLFILAGIARILFVNRIPDNLTRGILLYIVYVGLGSAIGILHRVLVQKIPPKDLISRVDTSIISLSSIAGAVGALFGGFLASHVAHVDIIFYIQGGSYIAIGALLFLSKSIRTLPKISAL